MTIHERSAWVSIGAMLVLYIPYFMEVQTNPMQGLVLFWVVGVGMAIILVIFHTIDAIMHVVLKRSGSLTLVDEFDQTIQRHAAMIAGGLLAVVVMSWIIVMMYLLPLFGSSVVDTSNYASIYVAWPIEYMMRAVHWLFAGFVLSNIVYYAVVIYHYRSL